LSDLWNTETSKEVNS